MPSLPIFSLNQFLSHFDFDLETMVLMRHDHRALGLYREGGIERFGCFISFQKKGCFKNKSWACHFIPGERTEEAKITAKFVGITKICEGWEWNRASAENQRCPRLFDPVIIRDESVRTDPNPEAFDLEWYEPTMEWAERLMIDWGGSAISWRQLPHKQQKKVISFQYHAPDKIKFPGFANFQSNTQDLYHLPSSWRDILSATRGVYLLVAENGQQYIGSASGQDGFWGRWMSYVDGDGGNKGLKKHHATGLQVSILQTASSTDLEKDILRMENNWKDKLGTRVHGLNFN